MSQITHEQFFNAVTEVIEGVCTHADELKIYTENTGNRLMLCVYPHQADYPKLVGAKGKTVNAIKHLFVRAAVNLRLPLSFTLEQSFNGRREERAPFVYNPDFNLTKFEQLFRTITGGVFPSAEFTISPNGEDISIVVKEDRSEDHTTTCAALAAMFYPYGFAQGRIINIRLGPKV